MTREAARQALVWIDSRRAVVLGPGRRVPIAVSVVRSDVPVHRRAMGHVRHAPNIRHGGGQSQVAAEHQRLEHLARFLARVIDRLEPMSAIDLIGPGELPRHLAEQLGVSDHAHGRTRRIQVRRAGRLSSRQLIAAWKALAGEPIRRVRERRHGWQPGRMGKARRAVRPALDDPRLSPEADA